MQTLGLTEFLPIGWQVLPAGGCVRLIAPCRDDAHAFFQGAGKYLKASAESLKAGIELVWEGCTEPLRVEVSGSYNTPQPQPNSYGASRLASNASYEAVMDFIASKQSEGLIVTVMSMGSDKFLYVNGAQVADRGGNVEVWIGSDAKSLVWMRSLMGTLPGRDRGVNYYARLHELLQRDRFIDRYEYCVTRPNGNLCRDVSSYFYLDNYLGVPARVAVSVPGQSELVEVAA